MLYLRQFFLTLFILSLFQRVSAQLVAPDKIRSLTADDGLPQGYITGLLLDTKGFMWISTLDGLGRYDGHNFKNFRHDEASPASLASNIIEQARADRENRIWLRFENGQIDIFDPATEKARHLSQEKAFAWLAPDNLGAFDICEDKTGRIYILGFDKDATKRTIHYFTWQNIYPAGLALPNGEFPVGMCTDEEGNLWVAGNRSLYVSAAHQPLTKVDDMPSDLIVQKYFAQYQNFQQVEMMRPEQLLCSDAAHAWVYSITEKNWQNITAPVSISGFTNSFKVGKDGSVYLFNRKAVYRIDKNRNYSPIWFNDTKYDYTTGIIDSSGMIWIGTNTFGVKVINPNRSGFGSYKYTYESFFDIVPQQYALKVSDVNRVGENYSWMGYLGRSATDGKGNLWLANLPYAGIGGRQLTRSDIVKFSNGKTSVMHIGIKTHEGVPVGVSNFTFDNKGRCWVLADNGVLANIDPENKHISDSAKVVPDGEKAIYILAADDKLCLVYDAELQFYNPQTRQSTFYKNQPGLAAFHNVTFLMAVRDPVQKNILWLATRGSGLIKFDFTNATATAITEKNGIPNNTVYAIVPDKHGFLWCSSNKGIFRFNPAGNGVLSFTKKDGLQGNEFNRYQFLAMPDGHIAFGGTNGATVFHPDSIKFDDYKPQIAITNISINNNDLSTYADWKDKSASYIDSLYLSYEKNFLTFHFAGLEYNDPEKLRYRYMLTGVDKKWNDANGPNYASYSNLQPGSYTFRVNASNTSGVWSGKVKTIYIHISPPWWRSWLAYACYFILLALGVRQWMKFMGHRASLQAQLQFEQTETKRIQELDLAKTQFYTNISHEFRTPLTVILGMARKIADDTAHIKIGSDLIIRSGQNLLNLVNEMLDLSKLQSGKMVLDMVNGDIIAFLRYLVESFHSLSENQNKQIHFLSKLEYYYTQYDPEKMRQVISNLLSNALKFTPDKGNIYISVNLKEIKSDADETGVVITVTDTGIGIPEDNLPFIFDRFYQVDNSSTKTTAGTGIGLSLTKELVKLMKGEIAAKSPPTGLVKGTEFTIELPLKKLPATDQAIVQTFPGIKRNGISIVNNPEKKGAVPQVTKNNTPLILLVEDNADVVAYIAFCLPGYRLAVAQDGVEGFELATELIPDLIISDVMMPRLDGFGLLQKIKEHEHTSHIPIIMLTAKADMESKMEGISRGADAYLEKPFNNDELQLRIKKLLELRTTLQKFYLKKAGLTDISEPGFGITVKNAAHEIEDKFVARVRTAIEARLADNKYTVEQLCSDVFMSHSNLLRKLDALTGCSPNKFIRIVRLKKAKELLNDETKSIYAVAIECGFSDPGYFGRVFKQEFGVTPNEWRNRG